MDVAGRILFWVRPDFYSHPGGDSVQAEQWATILRKLGVTVVVSSDPHADLSDFDAVHLWHLERAHDSFYYFIRAQQAGKRVFLVTTYWPASHRPLTGWRIRLGRGLFETAKLWARVFSPKYILNRPLWQAILVGWISCRDRMLNDSNMLIANSESEAAILRCERSEKRGDIKVIPNIVASSFLSEDVDSWAGRERLLCIGHFCPRKNQMGLIRALRGTGLRVTFVGGERPMHRRYYRRCLQEGRGQHQFLGRKSIEETRALIRGSRLVICVSQLETPGISNLEAAALGCGLLVPDIPPIRDYFGCLPFYFSDLRATTIRQQVCACITRPPDPGLAEVVKTKYVERELVPLFQRMYSFGSAKMDEDEWKK